MNRIGARLSTESIFVFTALSRNESKDLAFWSTIISVESEGDICTLRTKQRSVEIDCEQPSVALSTHATLLMGCSEAVSLLPDLRRMPVLLKLFALELLELCENRFMISVPAMRT